jgi:hypothetical protein
MFRFVLRRIGMVIPTFIGITILAFALIHLIPGDPIEVMMGERGVDPAMHAAAMHRLGLDESLPMQYVHYIGRALHGDLGTSIITNTSVMGEFLARFPATVELSICAMLFALIVGLPAGVFAALRRGTVVDHGADRLLDADFLVGLDPHHGVLGEAWLDAGVRPHRGGIRHSARDRLHADRRDDVHRRRRVQIRAEPSDPAGHRARHDSAGGRRAHDAFVDARSAA